MILDARSCTGMARSADIAIVGSGAAGIPMALELEELGFRVLLLESGSEEADERGQECYEGTVASGSNHPPTDKYRQRKLGGTTGTWGGRCVPFDPIDFEPRDYVPNSGWPISFDEVASFYGDASAWLEAGDSKYQSSSAFPRLPPLIEGFESAAVSIDSLERFSRPTDVFNRYKDRLRISRNVTVMSSATCTRINLEGDGLSVKSLTFVATNGREFDVTAARYVLAVGGIETARLLLASNDVRSKGVGNEHDVVGRYYMCHVAGNVGSVTLNVPLQAVRHEYEISPDGVYCRRRFQVFEDEQRKRQINNIVARLHFARISDPGHRSSVLSLIYLLKPFISYEYATRLRDGSKDTAWRMLKHFRNVVCAPMELVHWSLHWVSKRILATRKFPSIILKNKTNKFSLEINVEQCPLPESRVTLGDTADRFGTPRVVIDWRYSDRDIDAVKSFLDLLKQELVRLELGNLEYSEDRLEAEMLRFGAYGGHHIGTARMGNDPATSVVDRDCKVHDVDNLYIAGSAVFPTSSQANPTLTITALAVRLARHLSKSDLKTLESQRC